MLPHINPTIRLVALSRGEPLGPQGIAMDCSCPPPIACAPFAYCCKSSLMSILASIAPRRPLRYVRSCPELPGTSSLGETMNWKSFAFAFTGALLLCASAIAATETTAVPTLSGKYAFVHNTFCQPTVLVNYQNGTPFLINLNAAGAFGGWGDIQFEVGVVTFNATKLIVTAVSNTTDGSPVMLQSSGGGPNNLEGTPLAASATGGKATYANSATSLTLQGQVYNAAYGSLTSGGIANHVSAVG